MARKKSVPKQLERLFCCKIILRKCTDRAAQQTIAKRLVKLRQKVHASSKADFGRQVAELRDGIPQDAIVFHVQHFDRQSLKNQLREFISAESLNEPGTIEVTEVKLIPDCGRMIFCSDCPGTDEAFAAIFRRVWEKIPQSHRDTMVRSWGLRNMSLCVCLWPTERYVRQFNTLSPACTHGSYLGCQMYFDATGVFRLQADWTELAIAHELAHAYLFATRDQDHVGGKHEAMEGAADRLLSEWRFDIREYQRMITWGRETEWGTNEKKVRIWQAKQTPAALAKGAPPGSSAKRKTGRPRVP